MQVQASTIEKIWQRCELAAQPPFQLWMAGREYTAINLYGGPVSGHLLRSDGVIARWDWDLLDSGENYAVESDPGWCLGALVIGAERIPELSEVLPTRPNQAATCVDCNGMGFLDLPNAPSFLLCQTCWGLGWLS